MAKSKGAAAAKKLTRTQEDNYASVLLLQRMAIDLLQAANYVDCRNYGRARANVQEVISNLKKI